MADAVSAMDFEVLARPPRTAILVPSWVKLRWVADELIRWCSAIWGGHHTLIVPLPDEHSKTQLWDGFFDMLDRFDPDNAFAATRFSDALIERVMDCTRMKKTPFVYETAPGNVHPPEWKSMHRRPFADYKKSERRLLEIAPTEDEIADAWVYSRAGRLGALASSYETTGWTIERQTQAEFLKTSLSALATTSAPEWPLSVTTRGLGRQFRGPEIMWEMVPPCVVVGDSLEDWALYWNLSAMREKVLWIPRQFEVSPIRPDAMLSLKIAVKDLLDARNPVFTSISLDDTELSRIINTHKLSSGVVHTIERDVNVLLETTHSLIEVNNTARTTTVFNGSRSVTRLNVPIPKTRMKKGFFFLVDAYPNERPYLGHPATRAVDCDWANPRVVIPEFVRRTASGGFCFSPIPLIGHSWTSVRETLLQPRVPLPNLLSDAKAIAATLQLRAELSDKGRRAELVRGFWEGDLDQLCKDILIDDSKRLFLALMYGGNRPASGVNKGVWLDVRGEIYLSPNPETQQVASLFTPQLELSEDQLSRWMATGVIERGVVAQCGPCGRRAFYSEERIVGGCFRCQQCNSENRIDSRTVGSNYPKFVFGLSPTMRAFLSENGHVVAWGLRQVEKEARGFDFTTEIELFSLVHENKRKAVKEFDMLMNCAGELWIGEAKLRASDASAGAASFAKMARRFQSKRLVFASLETWSEGTKINVVAHCVAAGYHAASVQFIDGPMGNKW